jgi:hypothetical protein
MSIFSSLDINGIDWRAIANYGLDYLRTLSSDVCAGARQENGRLK